MAAGNDNGTATGAKHHGEENDVQQRAHSPDIGRGDENDKKRKRFGDHKGRFGSGGKKRDLGRKEWHRENLDKRQRNEEEKAKRQSNKPSVLPTAFAEEDIKAEDRQPKRKVAVLVGYSGTGYKGMQISTTEKTIEGDLFTAFVKAGAISKANADDPKKSSLVRCARTDKGVHAAGNMISLKLIVEDPDIVQKINEALSPQIRVWGIERTIGSFSCYQACDSRWYEYLIPSHALLPPHPSSCLMKKIKEYGEEVGDFEDIMERQKDVEGFWEKVEEEEIRPALAEMDDDIRELVKQALYPDWDEILARRENKDDSYLRNIADMEDGGILRAKKQNGKKGKRQDEDPEEDAAAEEEPKLPADNDQDDSKSNSKLDPERGEALFTANKRMKQAYDAARRRYRIDRSRIDRLQEVLSAYVGTRNFHNYTISKTFHDPSAKRTIKSFVVNPEPILINGTEWLSLKVHGQSFMMHQIRKMVGMAALLVRCGSDGPKRIKETYERERWPIPKVPGLGLLLERPVFDSYNKNQAQKFGKELLDFGKYEADIIAFKQKEIYERIWEEEARSNTFHQFFNHIDNYTQPHFLYLTSKGWEATKRG